MSTPTTHTLVSDLPAAIVPSSSSPGQALVRDECVSEPSLMSVFNLRNALLRCAAGVVMAP
jgi:hypothetical protein